MILLHVAGSALFIYLFWSAQISKPLFLLQAVATKPAKFTAFSITYILAHYDLFLAMLVAAALLITSSDLKQVEA